MSRNQSAVLSNGQRVPLVGYGTWLAKPGEVEAGVFEALNIGYRHLDLAKIYRNQREVAKGLKRAFAEIPGLKREDVFITSKLWNTQHHPDLVEPALDDCLEELGLDYLDLYLIHFPVSFKHEGKVGDNLLPRTGCSGPNGVEIDDSISIVDTWQAMTRLPQTKVRAIGVSNFSAGHIKAITKATGICPSVNQVERHPCCVQSDLAQYCKEANILLVGYSSFGNNVFGYPLLVDHPDIKAIAARYSATPAQIIVAWAQVGGHGVLVKSVTPSRIAENFNEIQLRPEDVAEINNKYDGVQTRYNIPFIANTPRWDINIFGDSQEMKASHTVVTQ